MAVKFLTGKLKSKKLKKALSEMMHVPGAERTRLMKLDR